MAQLYGKHYTKSELLAHVGDISQVARIKPYRLIEGFEDGVFALDVTNGSGLDFTVLASRGMDISSAHYNGRSMMWRSATTDSYPAHFDHEGEGGRGWLRSFYGGLVVTCGLTWAGANDTDNGIPYGIHGRIGNTPATNVQWDGVWEGDDYLLTITGKLREATVFGENLQMTRTITTKLGSNVLHIHDTVENLGAKPTEHMMLYHINIGFPAVNDTAELISTSQSAVPRDPIAEERFDRYTQMQAPEAGYQETVYFHELATDADGYATAAVIDKQTESGDGKGFGVYCKYLPTQLPRFIEWKMMDSGTYVVGMEPANCLVMGRPNERRAGTLQVLQPGEVRHYSVEIGVLAGEAAVSDYEAACKRTLSSK